MTQNLQGYLTEAMRKVLTPEKIMYMMLSSKLYQAGITPNDEELENLRKQIADGLRSMDNGVISFDLNLSDESTKEQTTPIDEINWDITDDDIEEFKQKIRTVNENAIKNVIIHMGDVLLDKWKEIAPTEIARQDGEQEQLRENIRQIWGKPIALLDILVSVALVVGSEFNEKHRASMTTHDLVFEALTRLHARGCQIGREIHLLLANGFADGAHARWRTLHEIMVIACFIAKYGKDVAERYLLYEHVETRRNMLQYKQHYKRLGLQPLTKQEEKDTEEQFQLLKKLYGKDYITGDYGWAAKALGKKQPNFADIEKNVSVEHVRPFVKMANSNVHASAKGILNRLGIFREMGMILAGASNLGLGDPGRNTAFAIAHLTGTVLLSKRGSNYMESMAHIHAMTKLRNEIHDAFYESELKIDEMYQDVENDGDTEQL